MISNIDSLSKIGVISKNELTLFYKIDNFSSFKKFTNISATVYSFQKEEITL